MDANQTVTLETGRRLLPYLLFMRKSGEKAGVQRHVLYSSLLVAFLYYIVPSIVAVAVLPETISSSPSLQLPYFRDFNVMFMCLVTFPAVFYLLMTEQELLSKSITQVLDQGTITLRIDRRDLFEKWNKTYGRINVVGQVVAAAVGIAVSYGNYAVASSKDFHGWQVTNGSINIPGALFIFLQMPLFFYLVITYLVRTISHIAFFIELAKVADFKLSPVDPDNAGGLGPIGRIGLRNQYALAIGGINVGLFLVVKQSLNRIAVLDYLFAAAAIFYVVAGPLGFLGPLLPFRSKMLESKRQYLAKISNRIKKEFETIIDQLPSDGYSEAKHQEMQRFEHLQSIARKIPVWPFDSRTLRRFVGAYVVPFGTFLLGPLIGEVVKGLAEYIFR